MHRFFKVELETLNNIRLQVMEYLEQPNGRAEEPWQVDGDFSDDTHGYIALAGHHTEGDFKPLVDEFINFPGVEEITAADYVAARPLPTYPQQ